MLDTLEGIGNSHELFILINSHRELSGKKPMKNHRELVRKIEDEVGNLHMHKKVHMQSSTANGGFRKFVAYELCRKEVMLVSMRESKEVRSSVYDYILKLEEELSLMKSLVWKVINDKSYISREMALKSAGIEHPRLFMKYLRNNNNFYEDTHEKGYLKEQYVSANTKVEMFTKEGFKWLLSNREKANNWVSEQKSLWKLTKATF